MSAKLCCLLGFSGVLACGPTEPGGPARGGGGSAGTSSSAGNVSAGGDAGGSAQGGSSSHGGSDSAGGNATRGGAASSAATGFVQFGELFMKLSPPFESSARFSSKDAVGEYDCDKESFGDCSISTCKKHDGPLTPMPGAGTIIVSDGNMINVSLAQTPGQAYPSVTATSGLKGGEKISVSASGGEVPAFMASVAVPLVITISSPELDTDGMNSVPRSADLELVYDNRAADGETGTRLMVQSQSSGSPLVSLSCDFATDSGKATVPAAALSKLDQSARLLLLTTRSNHVQAGDFDVTAIAYISAMNPAKTSGAVLTLN